jgi:hypothetical protein
MIRSHDVTDTVVDPTAERIVKAGTRFEPREISQAKAQRANRISSWHDEMARTKGGKAPILTPEQAMAARDVDMLWHVMHDERGITPSYGSSRFNGTPAAQMSQERLLGPEWRETCRSRLAKAKAAVNDPALWAALCSVIERDGTATDAGHALGYRARVMAQAAGVVALRAVLHRLAVHFGYLQNK